MEFNTQSATVEAELMKTAFKKESWLEAISHCISKGLTSKRESFLANNKKERSWWEPFLDFCEDTSLHGLKYIGQAKRHVIERLFWLFAFIIGLCVAAYLISDVWNKYNENPVIISFQPFETTIDRIPFPAITICNMNKVLKSKADNYIRIAKSPVDNDETAAARYKVYYLDHVCSTTKSFSKRFNFSLGRGAIEEEVRELATKVDTSDETQQDISSFLRDASQRCSDMIGLCQWQGEVVNCSKLFRPIDTDFGKCCTFNSFFNSFLNESLEDPNEIAGWNSWDLNEEGFLLPENQNSGFPRRQQRAGKSSGLSILLDPDLDEYFCTTSDSKGFRVLAHLSVDVPHVEDFGSAIRANAEIFMNIRPEITMADHKIKNFPLEKRQCYFKGEKTLGYYKYYTASNCIDECVANITYKVCGCVRYFMPRDNSRGLCGPSKFVCAENIKHELLKDRVKLVCTDCLPLCTELEYILETTGAPIQNDYDIWIDEQNKKAKWSNRNVSIVHMYFGLDSCYARLRKELYGTTDLIANTGGLMGLCLGFSGLSLMEVLYFLTLRALCNRRRRREARVRVARKAHQLWKRPKSMRKRKAETKITNENSMQVVASVSNLSNYNPSIYMNDLIIPVSKSSKTSSNKPWISTLKTVYNLPSYTEIFGDRNNEQQAY